MNRIIVLTIWAGLTLATVLIMFGNMAESTSDEDPTLVEKEEEFRAWIGRVAARTPKEGGMIGNRVNLKKSKKGKDKSKDKGKVVNGVIRVNKKGKGGYKTVQAAVNAVPINNNQRVVIQIDAGIYKEKVDVSNRPFITFEGAGAKSTVITWHDTAGSAGGTFSSASVAINSDNFIAKGISFENSAPPPPGGAVDRQAVALRISGDKAAFYNCTFLGAQDTLYDHQGRHYFENCYIQGSIDFICGDGQSLYSGCTLHAISSGSFTAQKRDSQNEETGFSFVNCNVTGSGMLYLGRAWGRFSRVVYSYTYMDPIIKPAGWFNWGDPDRNNTVFYGQYKCSGPGAVEDGRVVWSMELSDEEAAPFQSLSYINGEEWIQS